jgi:formate dehydrogenase alpha subunit
MTTVASTETEGRKVDTIKLTINGRQVKAGKGATVLEAALGAGIYIPTLCYNPDLKPYGGCRLCVVEIEGMRGLVSSCTTPATEGMIVQTETPKVNQSRRITMELISANHHGDCLACAKNQDCELLEIAQYLGMEQEHIDRLRKSVQLLPVDKSHPMFIHDPNKCILCAICVRACHEITYVGAIDIAFRGNSARVTTFGDKPIVESICKSCGECVARCPTGALVPKWEKPPAEEVKTICPYCGVGCSIYLGVRDNKIVSVRGDRDGLVNRGSLCVKGRFGIAEFVHHPERLTSPLIKKNGELKEASWDEALELVAKKLRGYTPDEVGVIASAKCTNEENYVMQKFARAVLGTNNVDHCARLCHAPTVAGLVQSFGSGAMTNSINEIGDAACILAIGTNTTEDHPIIGMEVKKAVNGGGKLIVANPREIDLCRFASLWLQHNPGTDVALLMGMMRVIVDEGLLDSTFIKDRCENFNAFKESLKDFDLDFVERVTKVPRDKIVEAARMFATNSPATILYSMGITQHSHGTDNVLATANIAMLTGNVGKLSTGVNPLRGQNNVQGACDMGALPNVYPGYQAVSDPAIREKFETAWGCGLPPSPGLTLVEMLEAAYQRKIKALYLIGENPVLSDPDSQHVREALSRLEFFVVQDIFPTETVEYAHVVLPGASFAEKDGTFTNTERRVQLVRKAIEPIGDSKPDWWIVCQVAKKLGAKGFDYSDPSEIMEEIRNLTPSYGGISYQRLENGGIQWPCPLDDHPGTPILHTDIFVRGKGRFMPLKYIPPGESPDEEYPLILTTGRSLYHFHTGTMTRKVAGLNVIEPEGMVEISPEDAAQLGISQGGKVKISSRRGEVIAKAKVTDALPSGVVFMTFHFAESAANILTNPKLDPVSKIPELKVSAVKVEKL